MNNLDQRSVSFGYIPLGKSASKKVKKKIKKFLPLKYFLAISEPNKALKIKLIRD